MISIRAYRDGDAFLLTPSTIYDNDKLVQVRTNIIAQYPDSFCSTLVNDSGKPVAVLGLTMQWAGMGEVWSVLSEEAKKNPIALTKYCRKLLDFYARELKVKRYQATVRKDYCTGQKWLAALGFRFEAELSKYGPGGVDHHMWRRLS